MCYRREWLIKERLNQYDKEINKGLIDILKSRFSVDEEITKKDISDYLRELELPSYRDSIPYLYYVLNGKRLPVITDTEKKVLLDYCCNFYSKCKTREEKMTNINFLIKKGCEFNKLDHLIEYFPQLSIKRYEKHEEIFNIVSLRNN